MSISLYKYNHLQGLHDWSEFLDEFESGELDPPMVEVIEPEEPRRTHCCSDCGCECGGCN